MNCFILKSSCERYAHIQPKMFLEIKIYIQGIFLMEYRDQIEKSLYHFEEYNSKQGRVAEKVTPLFMDFDISGSML